MLSGKSASGTTASSSSTHGSSWGISLGGFTTSVSGYAVREGEEEKRMKREKGKLEAAEDLTK